MSLQEIPRWKRGDALKAKDFNALAKRLKLLESQFSKARGLAGSDTSRNDREPSAGGTVKRFTIASEQNDTVTATDATVIAKPEYLRGATTTRFVGTEPQAIYPAYVTGGPMIEQLEVYAMQSENGTGVAGVDWIDLNVQARTWVEDVVAPPAP